MEVPVDGFHIDIVRGDLMIEIQTGNFSVLKKKINSLLLNHPLRLVYPIAKEKWIVKVGKNGQKVLGRRKSPKHGSLFDLFDELVSIPQFLLRPNFSIHVLLIREEEVRAYDASRCWRRRGWVTLERRLIDVVDHQLFMAPQDMEQFIPATLEEPFTTADLAEALHIPSWLSRQMAYCFRKMGTIKKVGKKGNAILYCRVKKY